MEILLVATTLHIDQVSLMQHDGPHHGYYQICLAISHISLSQHAGRKIISGYVKKDTKYHSIVIKVDVYTRPEFGPRM